METIFSSVLRESGLDGIIWVETKRETPKEFFGLKPDDEFDQKFEIGNGVGSPRVPPDIGDAFNYNLQGSLVQVNFGQEYYNSIPLATYQYISFDYGRQRNPRGEFDDPLGAVQGFEYLTKANMTFYRGQHGAPKNKIDMSSQNLGIHQHNPFGENNTFTEHGNAIMTYLLSRKKKFLKIPGIRDNEHKELETFLDLIEQKYKSAQLVPRDEFYT
jgi:hypothetical protein